MWVRIAKNRVFSGAVNAVGGNPGRKLLDVANAAEHGIELAGQHGGGELGGAHHVKLDRHAHLGQGALHHLADRQRGLVAAIDEQLPVVHVGLRQPRLLEQGAGFVEVEGVLSIVRLVRSRTGWCPRQGSDLAETSIPNLKDGAAVHQVVEGLAEFLIAERPLGGVDAKHLHQRTRPLNQLIARRTQAQCRP